MNEILDRLEKSVDPCVRYLFRRDYLRENPENPEMLALQEEIRHSSRVRLMLERRDAQGRFPWHPSSKWVGAFWTLLMLADIGYPPGDQDLAPLRDQVLDWLLSPQHLNKVPQINGRWRRCALQEVSIVYSSLKLGLANERIPQVVENLLQWQWPDGGWNCDKKPAAVHSSFHETWIPLLAMHTYALASGSPRAQESSQRASEVFLKHRLFRRIKDGEVMDTNFGKIAYPPYWHYDILVGLRVMDMVGRLSDPRCGDALDWLASLRLPDGGLAVEQKYYKVSADKKEGSGVSFVDWGSTGKGKMNEFATVHALSILKKAGRLN